MDDGRLFLLVVVAIPFYFLPAIVAMVRRHHNEMAIDVLNLLLGWTILGWIAALVWASTEVRQPPPPPPGSGKVDEFLRQARRTPQRGREP
jgi:hypothetical protein